MRLLTTIPIDEPDIGVRFVTPSGTDVMRAVQIASVEHQNEWVWLYELEFQTLLPESAM